MIKKASLSIFVAALIISSCGGGAKECDPATADGAAICLCEMSKAKDEKDKDKAMEMMKKYMEKMEEIEKNIKDGKYSENDVEAAAAKIDGCKM